jgi:hypothetical protein
MERGHSLLEALPLWIGRCVCVALVYIRTFSAKRLQIERLELGIWYNPSISEEFPKGSVATFRFCRKTPRFRDFAEKPIVDCEALRQGGFRAKPGFFGRIKSLQHFRFSYLSADQVFALKTRVRKNIQDDHGRLTDSRTK